MLIHHPLYSNGAELKLASCMLISNIDPGHQLSPQPGVFCSKELSYQFRHRWVVYREQGGLAGIKLMSNLTC